MASGMDNRLAEAAEARRARWEALTRDEAKLRVSALSSELTRHNVLYHTKGNPEVSDWEYDLLFRELTSLEARFPDLALADSPTRRVGGPPVSSLTPFGKKAVFARPSFTWATVFTHPILVTPITTE